MNKRAPTGQTGIYNWLHRSETTAMAPGLGRRRGEGLSPAARLTSSRVGRRDGWGSGAEPARTATQCRDAHVQLAMSNSMTTSISASPSFDLSCWTKKMGAGARSSTSRWSSMAMDGRRPENPYFPAVRRSGLVSEGLRRKIER